MLRSCGVLSAVGHAATDIAGSMRYPGHSFRGQAVSELLAIGAPTSRLVVSLFSLCSVLLLAEQAAPIETAGAPPLRDGE